jgi:Domain of unknown function (DUF5615)
LARLKIYADENVDIRVVQGLRRRGIEVTSALEEEKIGATDDEHFVHAASLGSVIFTHDPDFIEIASQKSQRSERHEGIIFAAMHRLPLGECIRRLALYAEVVTAEEMVNRIEFL